jgi:RNA polymerase sigma-70 factor (ECF subfamily)
VASLTEEEVLQAVFKYQGALTTYAFGLLRDWALAEDAVQDAYMVALRKRAEFEPDKNVFLWMRQIVRFEALNMIRARKRETYVDEELLSLVDGVFERNLDDEEAEGTRREIRVLRECLPQIRKESVDVVLGFYRDRLSCEKLASIHGRTVNAVRLLLSRTRKKLRSCMKARLAATES